MNKQLFILSIAILFSFPTFAQVPSYIDTAGLTGWWSFTGNANDSSGYGNNGTVYGATLTTDRFGTANCAYNYDGTSYILSGTTTNAPVGAHARSMSMWFRSTATTATYGYDGFGWGNVTNGQRFSWSLYHGLPYFCGQSSDIWGTGIISDNNWHNVIITFDGTTVNMFIDGVLNVSSPETLNTVGSQLFFGNAINLPIDANFIGDMDDIGIWSRVISRCEINKIFLSRNSSIVDQPANDTVYAGGMATYAITDTGFMPATYQWQENTGSGFVNLPGISPYSGVTTKTLTVNPVTATMTNYKYRCTRIDTGSCTDTSNFARLVIHAPNEISTFSIEQINISPNPAKNTISISFPEAIQNVEITNLLGQKLFSHIANKNSVEIDIQSLNSGVYLIRINNSYTKMFVKE